MAILGILTALVTLTAGAAVLIASRCRRRRERADIQAIYWAPPGRGRLYIVAMSTCEVCSTPITSTATGDWVHLEDGHGGHKPHPVPAKPADTIRRDGGQGMLAV
jgi:hypothetical protein